MKRSSLSGILLGIFVMAFGLLALGRGILGWNLSFLAATWWSLVIIAIAVLGIVHSGFKFWNVLFLLLGGCIFIGKLGFLGRHMFFTFFALLLIIFGIRIIVRAVSHGSFHVKPMGGYENRDSNDYPKYESVFSEYNVANDSRSFKGAHISGVFGQMSVDLSEISIQGNVVLDVSAVFGTLEIKLPRNIPYQTRVTPVFGTFINNAPVMRTAAGLPFIEIKGAAVFGTIDLI
jgi:predicted membrane protein